MPKVVGASCNAEAEIRWNFIFNHAGHQDVAAAARNRQVEAGDLHTWSNRFSLIYFVTKVSIGPAVIDAEISNGRKSSAQRNTCVETTGVERVLVAVFQIYSQIHNRFRLLHHMGMHVDESRQAGTIRQIERRDTVHFPDVRRKKFDAAVFDKNECRPGRLVTVPVNQRSAMNEQRTCVRRIGRLRDKFRQFSRLCASGQHPQGYESGDAKLKSH